MKIIALVIVLATVSMMTSTEQGMHAKILAPFMNGPVEKLFSVYHLLYKKNYEVNSTEGVRRLKAFRANVQFIKEENLKGHSYTLGVGPFTDLSNEEYKELILPAQNKIPNQQKFFRNQKTEEDIYENFLNTKSRADLFYPDYTALFPPVKNYPFTTTNFCKQAQTIFAFTDTTSATYNKLFSKSLYFSAQQYLDCNLNNFSCDSPLSDEYQDILNMYTYYRRAGIALESVYPYPNAITTADKLYPFTGTKGTCMASSKFLPKIVSAVKLVQSHLSSECLDWRYDENFKNGPMIAWFDATSRAFQNYQSGIFSMEQVYPACETNSNFHMAVVAVGAIDSSNYYLKARNSWGNGWGEQGYIRIAKKDNFTNGCFTACTAMSLSTTQIPNA